MGLHIYSGALVRFYTNDWENEIKKFAREQGIEYQRAWNGDEPVWPTKDEAIEHLAWMRETIIETMKPPDAALWNDSIAEYHTIKLHDEAREAICLVAAHLHRPDLLMPQRMPDEAYRDQAYKEAGAKGYLIGPIAAFESALIVPCPFDGVSLIQSPLDEQVLTCSTALLRKALDFVREGYWRGEVDSRNWAERGLGFSRNSGYRDENSAQWIACAEPEESLRLNAEFAFSVYSSMLEFSDANGTAIALS